MAAPLDALAAAIAAIDAPEQIAPLASRALAAARSLPLSGRACVAHAYLVALMRFGDEPLPPEQWAELKSLCAGLSAFLRGGDDLDDVAAAYLRLTGDESLQ